MRLYERKRKIFGNNVVTLSKKYLFNRWFVCTLLLNFVLHHYIKFLKTHTHQGVRYCNKLNLVATFNEQFYNKAFKLELFETFTLEI